MRECRESFTIQLKMCCTGLSTATGVGLFKGQGGGKNAVAGIGKKCGKMRKKCGKCEKKCGIKCGFAKML